MGGVFGVKPFSQLQFRMGFLFFFPCKVMVESEEDFGRRRKEENEENELGD